MGNGTVLLIAGGGTLGTYTSLELLKMGRRVDVIGLDEYNSVNRNLRYIREEVSDGLLKRLFAETRYDAIVDFIHYKDPVAYEARGRLLMDNTDQLIYLSSYRVYADEEHPVKETSPQLLDVLKDDYFLENEDYAIPKSRIERFLRGSGYKNWTIVRPLISSSHFRLDIVTLGGQMLLNRSKAGKKILLPKETKDLCAGVGWAGNVGKQIAHLCMNPAALGEAFTLGYSEGNTWGDVADIYTELLGAQFAWIPVEDYMDLYAGSYMGRCILMYDRMYSREMDLSKVRRVTGLTDADFTSLRDGLIYELSVLSSHPEWLSRYDVAPDAFAKTDRYIEEHPGL